jgi:hypothetical protein
MSPDQFRSWIVQAMAKRERRAIATCHRFAENHPPCGTCDERCKKQWLEMLRLNSGAWGRILFGANKQLDRVLLPDDERQVIWKLLNKTRGDDDTCSPLAGLLAVRDRLAGEIEKSNTTAQSDDESLDDEDLSILWALASRPKYLMNQGQIAAATTRPHRLGRSTVSHRIPRLEKPLGLVHRPRGKKHGYTITPKGLARLAQENDK